MNQTIACQSSHRSITRSMNPAILTAAGLLFFYLLLYILPLGVRPLAMPDETRYAEIPREMLANHDWVTPRLNGLRYFEKPPLGYWLNAASIAVFGENEFAVRLPSALSVGLTALLVFLMAQQLSKNRRVAILATLIHLTFLEIFLVGTTSVLDNIVTLFLTAGIAAFYFAVNQTEKNKNHKAYWWLSGASMGLAFLSKGFLAFAVPVLVLVPWMLWMRHGRMLITKGWWVVLAAILVALPWALLIHWREGDFWNYFFWVEHIRRFTAENAQHKEPFYYFLMYLPALAFPWITLLPAALSGLRIKTQTDTPKRGAQRLLWLWLVIPFVFFSASSGKLATYILPCFPPFAVLTAVGIVRYLDANRGKLFDFGILFNMLLFLCLLVGLLISQKMDIGFRAYDAHQGSHVIFLSLTLLFSTVAGLIAFLGNQTNWKLAASLVMITPFLFIFTFVLPDELLEHGAPGILLSQYQNKISDETIIISEAALLRASAWYLKREDIYVIGRGEVGYGLDYPDSAHRLLEPSRLAALTENLSAKQSILLICHRACNGQYVSLLPKTATKHAWGEFTLWFSPPEITQSPLSSTAF